MTAFVGTILADLRNQGAAVFDRGSTLFAPLWVCERAVLAWVALVGDS